MRCNRRSITRSSEIDPGANFFHQRNSTAIAGLQVGNAAIDRLPASGLRIKTAGRAVGQLSDKMDALFSVQDIQLRASTGCTPAKALREPSAHQICCVARPFQACSRSSLVSNSSIRLSGRSLILLKAGSPIPRYEVLEDVTPRSRAIRSTYSSVPCGAALRVRGERKLKVRQSNGKPQARGPRNTTMSQTGVDR